MTKILKIASSSNLKNSYSRQIGELLAETITKNHPNSTIVSRDLAKNPLPHLSPEVLDAFFSNNKEAPELKLSNDLVDELLASDLIIIEAPMYNFGVPSGLKAWVDHIVRAGITFKYGPNGPEGLVKGKKAILVVASGGVYTSGPAASLEHDDSYLKAVLGFIGINPIETIHIEGVAMGEAQAADALAKAKGRVTEVTQKLLGA
jgi:FMN-dependent NADH-azoreductase